jgi:secreted Zn-dependent insulinase-like peptidase
MNIYKDAFALALGIPPLSSKELEEIHSYYTEIVNECKITSGSIFPVNKGISMEEFHGAERAREIKQLIAENGNSEFRRSKTYEEIYGNEKAIEEKKKRSETVKKLSNQEMKQRMKKSVGSCDHIKRGKSISEGKKGKSTNQQDIMSDRYKNMSDEEFLVFISNKTPRQVTRLTNLRNI